MSDKELRGRVFLFGKNIDTDQIYPGRFVELTDVQDVAAHAMEGADPGFVKNMRPGDFIVAGSNFGCGSSREHAAIALKSSGVGAVLAESFGRIFYRNAVNLGLPLLVCRGLAEKVSAGQCITLDVLSGRIGDGCGGLIAQAEPLSEYMLKIVQAGGIKPLLKQQLKQAGGSNV